jgi:hypothetical protein
VAALSLALRDAVARTAHALERPAGFERAPLMARLRAAYEAVLGDWNETQAVGAAAGIG